MDNKPSMNISLAGTNRYRQKRGSVVAKYFPQLQCLNGGEGAVVLLSTCLSVRPGTSPYALLQVLIPPIPPTATVDDNHRLTAAMSPAALPFEALAYTAHTTASTLDTVHILSTTILGLLSAGTGVATWWLTTRRRLVAVSAAGLDTYCAWLIFAACHRN
jgi:hypothetical protein